MPSDMSGGILASLRRKVPVSSEFGQARVRVLNVSPFCLYLCLAWAFQWQAVPTSVAIGAIGYIAYALIWVVIVHFSLFDTTVRRAIAATLDQVLPIAGLYLAGFIAGWVAWVPALGSIGSGLRFGTRYTWLSSAVCAPLMTLAFMLSGDWRSIPAVSTGIVLANVMVPLYMVVLVKRMEREKQAFELRAAHFEAATKHDALTGLLNRAGFAEVFDAWFTLPDPDCKTSAVLLLDLDGFKAINDACGHAVGDRILKSVAQSLTASVRAGDRIARLGGDEFGILLCDAVTDSKAEWLVHRILEAVQRVGTTRDELQLGVSIGICMLPNPELRNYDDILDAADRLMYAAKAAGKNQFRMLCRPANP